MMKHDVKSFIKNIYSKIFILVSNVQSIKRETKMQSFPIKFYVLTFLMRHVKGQHLQNFSQIGQSFVMQFYNTFDSPQRAFVRDFYDIDSVLIFNGEIFYGATAILDKFALQPFNNSLRNVTWSDFQPTNDGGIIVNVGGFLSSKDASSNFTFGSLANGLTIWFNEMFVLKPRVTSFYIQNQHFRTSNWRNSIANNSNGLYFV